MSDGMEINKVDQDWEGISKKGNGQPRCIGKWGGIGDLNSEMIKFTLLLVCSQAVKSNQGSQISRAATHSALKFSDKKQKQIAQNSQTHFWRPVANSIPPSIRMKLSVPIICSIMNHPVEFNFYREQ